jgi:hypothetical protein
MARLDRIPSAKQIAQVGSVIGRNFSRALVAGVAQLSEAQLTHGFDELVGSRLAFRRGVGLDATYTFTAASMPAPDSARSASATIAAWSPLRRPRRRL